MALLGQASSGSPEHLPEGGQVLRIPHWGVQTSSPGHIDIEALTAASSHLENRRQERREESRVPREGSQDVSAARPAHPASSLPDGETEAQSGSTVCPDHTASCDRGRVRATTESQWGWKVWLPHPQPHCLGRSCHRRGDEGRCRARWGPGRRSAVCRCHGERPVQGDGQWIRAGLKAETWRLGQVGKVSRSVTILRVRSLDWG